MKTPILKLYSAPVALLLLAGAFGSPSASADPRTSQSVSARFAYSRSAPAEEIYADLHRAAERLCRTEGPRPIALRRHDDACVASAMADGITRIGRTDLAEVHSRLRG